jgi:hypothetical protein
MSRPFNLHDKVTFRGVEGIIIADSKWKVTVGFVGRASFGSFNPWDLRKFGYGHDGGSIASWEFCQKAKLTRGYYVHKDDLDLVLISAHTGYHCKKCHNHFPFAEPNQPDGTMICWNCRNYPHYKGRL